MPDDSSCHRTLVLRLTLGIHQQRAQHVERVPKAVAVAVARLVQVRPNPAAGLVDVAKDERHHRVDDLLKPRRRIKPPGRVRGTDEHEEGHVTI